MSVTYFDCGNYRRYQVRVMRHGKMYSKTFNCADGKQKALRKAQEHERALLSFLGDPMSSAGRQKANRNKKGAHFNTRIEMDSRWGTLYAVVCYRRADGSWKSVGKSIGKYGLEKAMRLAIQQAKKLHVPNPDYVPKKKMPSKFLVEMKVKYG